MPVAQVALHFGANDIQGTLVREEIFRAAGSTTGTEQKIDELVRVRPRGRPDAGAARHALQRAAPVGRLTLARNRHDRRHRHAHVFRGSLVGIGEGGGFPTASGARDRRDAVHRGRRRVIRLGRIAYVNMAPVFFRLDAEVEEVVGVPTALNAQLVAGELDVAPISSIAYARNADSLRLLSRLCVSSEGAVDSIQLVSKLPLERDPHGRRHAGVGDLGRAHEGAASGRRARAARRGGRGQAADRRRRAEVGVRGPDAAPRPRPDVARAHRPADGVRGLGRARAGASGPRRARGRARRVRPRRARGARAARLRVGRRATATRPASSRGTSRSSATASARASAPASTRSSSSRTRSASSTRCPSCASSTRERRSDGDRARSDRHGRRRSSTRRSPASGSPTPSARAARVARPRRRRPRRERAARPPHRSRPDHVHRRPQPELHEHLRHRLRLLRLLPQPGRPPRGLPAAEAGDLQEDRGDARARRHRRADAGRPPPRPRDRVLRGPLPLDQGALPDPPARALAARDPAHLAPLEARRSRTRSRGCATPASTRSPAAAARSSSTACATSSRRRRRSPPSG